MDLNLISEFQRSGKSSHLPAYLRLRRVIRQGVESGEIGPGHSLPSERELAQQLALSRVTVR
ncbi:MAG: GntR family transcriptional regulator, partial [Gammaproteobacteria bacterium]